MSSSSIVVTTTLLDPEIRVENSIETDTFKKGEILKNCLEKPYDMIWKKIEKLIQIHLKYY